VTSGPGFPKPRLAIVGAVLLLACVPGWWLDRVAFVAAWLVGWCFCTGVVLGALANVWIHTLTGGAWGEPIRVPLLQLGRTLPALAVLFVPVVAGVAALYPWAGSDWEWTGERSALAFKLAWLQPVPFVLRAVVVLLVWNGLAWASRSPRFVRSRGFAAVALILYGFTVSIAAVDWIMSLMPLWYSSIFGLVVGVGQMLAGLALGAAAAARFGGVDVGTKRDLGNLLLAYVLTWGYLAFSQFLIIWSENLPHEIVWYIVRRGAAWSALGAAVVLLQFALPLLLLLFRRVKDSSRGLAAVAVGLLTGYLLEVCWLILPSVADRFTTAHVLWLLPFATIGLASVCCGLMRERALRPASGDLKHA